MRTLCMHRMSDEEYIKYIKKENAKLEQECELKENAIESMRKKAGSIVGTATATLKDNR